MFIFICFIVIVLGIFCDTKFIEYINTNTWMQENIMIVVGTALVVKFVSMLQGLIWIGNKFESKGF